MLLLQAIMAGTKKFTEIREPALAVFADPPSPEPWFRINEDSAARAATKTYFAKFANEVERQVKAFENGAPNGARSWPPGRESVSV